MATRFTTRFLRHLTTTLSTPKPKPKPTHFLLTTTRPFSARPGSKPKLDIGARARQHQTRRLWSYALAFSCIGGFIVIVLNQFQDQLVFYVTPTDALLKYQSDPAKSKFRLGGLVLENSVSHVPNSPQIEFVVTDLITDILVRYEGSLPDLFREGHSVVVEGFIKKTNKYSVDDDRNSKNEVVVVRVRDKEIVEDNEMVKGRLGVTEKARGLECFFEATEVLAKHDEKYMPAEVAVALERNKKTLEEEKEKKGKDDAAAVVVVDGVKA